jgi:hypothetical protein
MVLKRVAVSAHQPGSPAPTVVAATEPDPKAFLLHQLLPRLSRFFGAKTNSSSIKIRPDDEMRAEGQFASFSGPSPFEAALLIGAGRSPEYWIEISESTAYAITLLLTHPSRDFQQGKWSPYLQTFLLNLYAMVHEGIHSLNRGGPAAVARSALDTREAGLDQLNEGFTDAATVRFMTEIMDGINLKSWPAFRDVQIFPRYAAQAAAANTLIASLVELGGLDLDKELRDFAGSGTVASLRVLTRRVIDSIDRTPQRERGADWRRERQARIESVIEKISIGLGDRVLGNIEQDARKKLAPKGHLFRPAQPVTEDIRDGGALYQLASAQGREKALAVVSEISKVIAPAELTIAA